MRMNGQATIFSKTEKVITRLSEGMTLLSGLLLLIGVGLTSVSIIGRALISFGFGPVPGDYELVETIIGLSVFAFMPYCQLMRGHVGVDLFVIPLGNRAMNFTQFLGDITVTVLCLILTWRHYYGTIDKYSSHETSFILAFPIWWGYAVAFVFLLVLCVVCLFTVWRDFRELRQNKVYSITAGGH